MRLSRTHDVELVNALVNHPEVRPHIGVPDAGDLDLTGVVDRREHWFLVGEHGGFALMWSAPKVHEVHTFILKSGRGAWANAARAEMIDYARKHGAKMLWTKIPPQTPHVERFARQGGMQHTGEVIETYGVPHRVMMMELN